MNEVDVPQRLVEDGAASDEARRVLRLASLDRPGGDMLDRALTRFLKTHAAVAPSSPTLTSKSLLFLGIGALVFAGTTLVVSYGNAPSPEPSNLGAERPGLGAEAVVETTVSPPTESSPVPAPSEPLANVHSLPSVPTTATKENAPTRRLRPLASVERPRSTDADTFDAELQKLREARAQLTSGNAVGAMAELDDYDRRFPNGALAPEAQAMRIDALLAAGRSDEATKRVEAFLRAYPHSPQAARLQRTLERGAR